VALRQDAAHDDGESYQAATHLIFAFIAVVFGLGLASVIYLLTILR